MIAEISITPVGDGTHMAEPVSKVIRCIADSGLSYQVTAMGTLVEGPSNRVWDLLRTCHEEACQGTTRVITDIRIDYDDDDEKRHEAQALTNKVSRVEEVLGDHVVRTP